MPNDLRANLLNASRFVVQNRDRLARAATLGLEAGGRIERAGGVVPFLRATLPGLLKGVLDGDITLLHAPPAPHAPASSRRAPAAGRREPPLKVYVVADVPGEEVHAGRPAGRPGGRPPR